MYGRKRVYFMSLIGICLSGIGCSLATGVYLFFFFRLLLGAFISGYSVVGYALLQEIVGPSKRTATGIGISIFFPVSYGLMAILAYYIRGWRTLIMVSSLSGVGLLATWRYREIYNSTPDWKPYIDCTVSFYTFNIIPATLLSLQGGCWYKVGRSKLWQHCPG